jgi:DNA-binding transcriptional ArsR family regulator
MATGPFAALAHPIRRQIVQRRSGGATTVGQASRDLGVSKPTITRHLKLLEEAGVVTRAIHGRSHRPALRPDTLAQASEWTERQRTAGRPCSTRSARTWRSERTEDDPAPGAMWRGSM